MELDHGDDDNYDRFSPLFDVGPADAWPDCHQQPSAVELMDIEADPNSMAAESLAPSLEYSDMVWSPIPTQSTLNNWHMLTQTQKLSDDDDDFGLVLGNGSECSDSPADVDDADVFAIDAPVDATTAQRAPSPDMFVESPLTSQEAKEMAVRRTTMADGDVMMALLMVKEAQCFECSPAWRQGDSGLSASVSLPGTAVSCQTTSLSDSASHTISKAARPPLRIDHKSDVVTSCSLVACSAVSELNAGLKTVLKTPATDVHVESDTIPETPAESDRRSVTRIAQHDRNEFDTVPETLSPDTIAETPEIREFGRTERNTVPETMASIAYAGDGYDSTFCSRIEQELAENGTECAPVEFERKKPSLDPVHVRNELNTVPETLDPVNVDDATFCVQRPMEPDRKQPPLQHVRNELDTVPETPDPDPPCTGHVLTFHSRIDAHPVTSSDDDATFCSQVERLMPTNGATNVVRPNDAASLATLDLDPTFCSLIELELQQTRQPDTESFDFEEAIMRILHVTDLQSSSQAIADAQDSGTFDLRRMPDADAMPDSRSRQGHQQRIEQIVLKFLIDLTGTDNVCLDVRRIGWASCTFDAASQSLSVSQDCERRRVRTRHRIILLLHLMDIVYQLIGSTTLCTKRELYYNDPDLTQTVDKISTALRDISCMLDTQPWQLGVLSASKGLIAGPLRIVLANAETISFESVHRGFVLPHLMANVRRITSSARFVLVVEKDTVFNKLLLANVVGHFKNRCILLTGKGYPDINTRYLLNQLWLHLRLPTYVLCDADPHGIQIMLTYRFGSVALPMAAQQLAVPQLRWLGVRPSELTTLGLRTRPLAEPDDRLLRRMVRRPYVDETVRAELQWLQQHGRKAEIEALEALAKGYLVRTYLSARLREFL